MTEQDARIDHLVDEYTTRQIDRRQFVQRAVGLGLSVGAATLLLARPTGASARGAGVAAAASAQASKELYIRLGADIRNLDPAFEPADPDLQTIFNIYENLVSFKPGTFEVVNTLAETWEASKDGLRFAFKLKHGIPFHKNFGELTAQDVKFSYERIAGLTTPALNSPYSGAWSALQQVKVTGKYSGVVILKEPVAPLMTLTVPGNPGHIVSKKAVEELGNAYALHPIGTGPYEFAGWRPQQEIILKRFDKYGGANREYAAPSEWSKIHFYPTADENGAQIALESGQVDFSGIPISSIQRIKSNSKLAVTQRTTFGYKWLGMNQQHPDLQDKNVRLAIRYAIDVPSILAAAFDNKWPRANAIIPPNMSTGYWKKAPRYNRDVAKAKSYLSKSGKKNLSFTLIYDRAEPGGATVAQIIQSNLKDIGIGIDIVVQEHGVFLQTGAEAQKVRQLVYVGYGSQPDPAQSMQWFTCEQLNLYNYVNWCDSRFTELAAAAKREPNPAKRQKMYVSMQQIWDDAANVVWIAWPSLAFAYKKSIKPSLRPDGRIIAWNFRSS
jgi:peptide/nickel transport system substrate-binding protein